MLYVHIPFCHRKCTYCAFYSKATRGSLDFFVEALCREIEAREEPLRRVRTVYFGGGTPSLLSPAQLQKIWDCIGSCFDISEAEECTIEANPENLMPDYLTALRAMGFNRLSIGIQSFRDADLRRLNRVHSSVQAVEAIKAAQKAGFDNISVDLIYGLPEQSQEDWEENLRRVEQLGVQHLSCYALTVEENTMLFRQLEQGRLVVATEEMVEAQYNALTRWCGQSGFEQYEVSNFCKPGFHARHNSRYWDRTPYLGFGPAAHSFDGSCRRWNVSDVERYINENVPFEKEVLSAEDAHNEYVMTSLRTSRGIEKRLVDPRFFPQLEKQIKKYISAGLIAETAEAFRPTTEGLLHADGMAADLFV